MPSAFSTQWPTDRLALPVLCDGQHKTINSDPKLIAREWRNGMSDSKHTPGPWVAGGAIDARYLTGIGAVTLVRCAAPNDDRYVAVATLDAMGEGSAVQTSAAEREANARLIAAAPDLLAALKWALPLARVALENHRLVRLQAGHSDIGAQRGTDLGLWDDEVNARDAAETAIAKATKIKA